MTEERRHAEYILNEFRNNPNFNGTLDEVRTELTGRQLSATIAVAWALLDVANAIRETK